METSRLRLEPISLSHLEGFHRIWTNPDATCWASRGTLETKGGTRAWLSGLLPENRPGSANYAVFTKDANLNNILIGVIGVHRTDPIPELGYILHPSAWGKGYATEAVGAIIQHLFEARPELDTIEAKVDEKNAESIRVLQKCGFVEIETITGGAKLEWLDPPKRNMLVYRVERTKSIE